MSQPAPPPDADTFPALIERVRAGDSAAAEVLVRRYEPALRREVRFRLRDAAVRRVTGESDVCQMVLASFFGRAALGQFDLDSPADLLNLLMQIARNKVVDETRRRHRQKDQGAVVLEPLLTADGEARPLPVVGPTPSAAVAGRDLVAHLRARMTADERRVCDLRHAGAEWAAIAAELGEEADAVRKRYSRAIDRIAHEAQLDSLHLD